MSWTDDFVPLCRTDDM